MSPGSASQILARKKRRGVSTPLDDHLFSPVSSAVSESSSALPDMQIIEKRRRDRINHSLSELRRLVPSAFEKQVAAHAFHVEMIMSSIFKSQSLY